MPIETELKLEVEPEAAAFIEASELLSGVPSIVKHRALYFDTPDHKLLRKGISLRIRRAGRSRTQTLKATTDAAVGLFARTEDEMPVRNDKPVIDPQGPLAELLGKQINALAPMFEIVIERRIWMLTQGQSTIELAIDRGAAKVAGREARISEIELELRAGDERDLFKLARKTARIAPFRLGMASKADRGYELLGPAAPARKAEPIKLNAQLSAEDAFRQIALSCIRHYRLNEALLLKTWQPEALHQARVALRRLRSAFSIFGPLLGDEQANRFKIALRDVSGVLGEARNLDVLHEKHVVEPVRWHIDEAREKAYERVKQTLASEEVWGLMLDLVEWLSDHPFADDVKEPQRKLKARDFAAEALRHLRKKIGKHGRALRVGSDEDRHTVRKDAKKLRYASEFFVSVFNANQQQRRHGKFTKKLEKLQYQLGALNDHATAVDLVRALGVTGMQGADALLDCNNRSSHIKRAEAAWQDLVDLKPFWRLPA